MEGHEVRRLPGLAQTQSSYAADALARLPGRAALRARLPVSWPMPASTGDYTLEGHRLLLHEASARQEPAGAVAAPGPWAAPGAPCSAQCHPRRARQTPSTGCPSRLAASWWRWACPRAAAEQRAARAGREQRQAARRGNRPHRPQPVRRGLAARCLGLLLQPPPAGERYNKGAVYLHKLGQDAAGRGAVWLEVSPAQARD